MLGHVEHLVQAGFAIHWLHPKSKRPIGNDWSEKPVHTLASLKKSYRDGNNVGVRLGQYSKVDDEFLHVIDLDIRTAEHEAEALECLTELFPLWSSYPAVISGSGGASRHFYILCSQPFPSKKLAHSEAKYTDDAGKDHWDWEIDLFGTGKQVAMPPSIHPDTGKPYRWRKAFDLNDLDLGLGPTVSADHLAALIGSVDEATEGGDRAEPIGLTIDEARDLVFDLPLPDWCEDREGWFRLGMALHHEFRASDEAFKLWCDYSRQLPAKFDLRDQRRVWRSFKERGGRKLIRMATIANAVREARLESEFENLEDVDDFSDITDIDGKKPASSEIDDLLDDSTEPKEPVTKRQQKINKAEVDAALGAEAPPKVRRLNRRHAVAFVKGKCVIITEETDGSVSYGTQHDLHAWYENDRVATDKATEPVSKAWMKHKMRREYPNGIVFAPAGGPEGAYNHWRGFSVEPSDEGSCRLILHHMKHVLCAGNEKYYRYMIGWFAHLIQKPEDKPGVAMVLRGKKGAGKDTVADYVGELFPHHHIKIANQEQMTGKFNQHQEKCLMLHVEEGFWAGNKNAEGALKNLITSEKVFIEPKGLNGFAVASVLRLFLSSNEKWVVPATEDERRFFVLDVPNTYAKNGPKKDQRSRYFNAIRHERNNGGKAALLHYLQNYDLSGFDVREVPDTAALAQQKTEGLKNFNRWWFGMLEAGELDFQAIRPKDGKDGDWMADDLVFERSDFQDSYLDWMRSRRYEGDVLSTAALGKALRDLLPSLEDRKKRTAGKLIRMYRIPHLEECRRSFEAYLGSELMWDENQPIVEEPDDTEDDFS